MIPTAPPTSTTFQPSPTGGSVLPDPIRASAPPPKTQIEDTDKKTTAQKAAGVGKVLANDVQEGLSYANARRARDAYKPVQV